MLAVACAGGVGEAFARRSGSGRTVLLAKEADLVTRLVAMGGVTRRPLETKDLDNDCGRGDWGVLMPSTPFAYPQVVSRCFTTSDSVFPVNIRRLSSPITVSCNAIGVTAVRTLDEVDRVVRAVLQAEARRRCCGTCQRY